MKRREDMGKPCLRPLLDLKKKPMIAPFNTIENLMLEIKKNINPLDKLMRKALTPITWGSEAWLTQSKALLRSILATKVFSLEEGMKSS